MRRWRRRKFHRHKRIKRNLSIETRFALDVLFGIAAFLFIIPYLGSGFLPNLAWLSDNQILRLGLLVLVVIILVINLIGKRYSRAGIAFLVFIGLGFEAYREIPYEDEPFNHSKPDVLRVFTFNAGTKSINGVVEHLTSNNVDVACIQELYISYKDTMLNWAKNNGYDAHYQHLRRDSGMGVLLLSRGKIENVDTLRNLSMRSEWRNFMVAKCKYEQGDVTIVPIQLESIDRQRGLAGWIESWKFRHQQAKLIASVVDTAKSSHIVVAGDFNATPTDRAIKPLRKRLKDSWTNGGGIGLGGSWERNRPLFRIDAVLYDHFKGACKGATYEIAESDHLAYQVDLIW